MNFCTHAIEDFQSLRNKHAKLGSKEEAEALNWLISVLTASVKFKLPDGGRLINDHKGSELYNEMIRLPFNEVALEYSMVEGHTVLANEEPCIKRIALCISTESNLLHSSMRDLVNKYQNTGVFVISIFYNEIIEKWIACTGGFLLPLGSKVNVDDIEVDFDLFFDMQRAHSQSYNRTDSNFGICLLPFHYFPDVYKKMNELVEKTMPEINAVLLSDSVDEISSAIEFCVIMNCSNVKIDTIPASSKLNKKRLSNDKPPMFEYKMLILESDGAGIIHSTVSTNVNLGERSSPRLHLRRGHIRKLKDCTIWINHMMVGSSQHGSIINDYQILKK